MPYHTLSTKNKTDLQVITAALSFSTDGTKDNIQTSITNHLQSHPELKSNSRFENLYPEATGSRPTKQARPRDLSDENQPPPPQRRIIDDGPSAATPLSYPTNNEPLPLPLPLTDIHSTHSSNPSNVNLHNPLTPLQFPDYNIDARLW